MGRSGGVRRPWIRGRGGRGGSEHRRISRHHERARGAGPIQRVGALGIRLLLLSSIRRETVVETPDPLLLIGLFNFEEELSEGGQSG